MASKVARGALYGQVQRETGKWHDELRHSNLTFIRGAKPDPSEAGQRRQRRKRADAKLRRVADAPPTELEALSDRWSDYDASESLGVDTVTFDAEGAHVDGCDLPRCRIRVKGRWWHEPEQVFPADEEV